jgi:hypothetical protein
VNRETECEQRWYYDPKRYPDFEPAKMEQFVIRNMTAEEKDLFRQIVRNQSPMADG